MEFDVMNILMDIAVILLALTLLINFAATRITKKKRGTPQ